MKSYRLYILLLLSLVISPLWADSDGSSWWNTDYNTTEGTEFWVTFMFNYGNLENDTQLGLRVFATAREKSEVTIHYMDGSTEKFTVKPYSRAIHVIDRGKGYISREKEVQNKGIYITSTKKISLYAVNENPEAGSQDATIILPTSALQKEYVISTYQSDGISTEFAIVSTEDTSTDLTINIRRRNEETGENKDSVIVLSSLRRGDVYLFRSQDVNCSLSGTKICSDIPIAVFQGGQHADIPKGASQKNHLYVQSIPTDLWGRTTVSSTTSYQKVDYTRIISISPNNANITRLPAKIIPSISQFETYQDTIASQREQNLGFYYHTSTPHYVHGFITDANLNGDSTYNTITKRWQITPYFGSPAMTSLTPIEYGIRSLVFSTLDAKNIIYHYINIATYKGNKIYIDDESNPITLTDIPNSPYAIANIELDTGAHFIRCTDTQYTTGVFTAHIYGLGANDNGRQESYAYSAGFRTNRSIDILINDEYKNGIDICIDKDPVKFSAVINFDYDNIEWISSLEGDAVKQGRHDSIFRKDYHKAGTDSLYLIVRSHTPLCNYDLIDTIKVNVNVHDTVHIDEKDEYGEICRKICYGNTFAVKYKDSDNVHRVHTFIADTTTTQKFLGRNQRLRLNTEYIVKDSFETSWGCDSVIWQRFIIRPTYDTTVVDTICVNQLPYKVTLSDTQGANKFVTIDLTNDEKKTLRRTTQGQVNPLRKQITETLQTIYGCDSVVHVQFVVLPTYNIKEPDVTTCIDSIHYFQWNRHTSSSGILYGHKIYLDGERITNGISLKTPGTYTYIDSLKTSGCKACNDSPGCDSVLTITIKVLDQVKNEAYKTLCDNQSFVWKDSLYLGPQYNISSISESYKQSKKYRRIGNTTLSYTYQTADEYHCDALDLLYVTWCPTYSTIESTHICENETYQYRPRAPMSHLHDKDYKWECEEKEIKTIVLTDTVETITKCSANKGCDSVVTHIVYVHPVYCYALDTVVCQLPDGKFAWQGHDMTKGIWDDIKHKRVNEIPIDKAGNYRYVDSLKTITCTDCKNTVGCDSIWTLTLKVNPMYDSIENRVMCDNDTVHWRGKIYVGDKAPIDLAGSVGKRYAAETDVHRDISHLWNGQKYTDSIHLHTVAGCDSIYWFELTVNPTYDYTLPQAVTCINRLPYEWRREDNNKLIQTVSIPTGSTLPLDTILTDTLPTIDGCDSILHLPLRVYTIFATTVDTTICETEMPFQLNPQTEIINLPASGLNQQPWNYTKVYNLTSHFGCDSIVTLHLSVLPTLKTELYPTICPKDLPYKYNDDTEEANEAGDYTFTVESKQYGCDSVVTIHLQVRDKIETYIEHFICDYDESYTHPTETKHFINLSIPGIYRDTLASASGCDSIVILRFDVHQHDEVSEDIYICRSDLPHIDRDNGLKVYSDSTYQKSLTNYLQCDSIVTTHVIVGDTFRVEETPIILCEREGEYVWTPSDTYGSYPHTIRWGDLHQQVWDTTLVDTLHTAFNVRCDSITSVHIMVKPTTIHEQTVSWCKSAGKYEYGEKGKKTFDSGFYIDTLLTPNQYGCDSVLWLTLDIIDSIYYKETRKICDNDTVSWQHILFVGTHFADSYDTSLYDSIRTVTNGVYKSRVNYKTAFDCDSTYYFTLTVNPAYMSVALGDTTLISICENETYTFKTSNEETIYNRHGEWERVDKQIASYIISGMDTTHLGCDSAVVHVVTVYPTYNLQETLQTCQGNDFSWIKHESHQLWDAQNKKRINAADIPTNVNTGEYVYIDSLTTHNGHACDSIWTLTLHIDSTYYHADTITISDEESLKWEHTVYIGSKVRQDTLNLSAWFLPIEEIQIERIPEGKIINDFYTTYSAIHGCDSTMHLRLLVGPTFRDTIYRYTCDNEPYHWYHASDTKEARTDIVLLEPNLYYDSLKTVEFGFDSIYVLNLTNNPTYSQTYIDTACQADGNYIWQGHENSPYYYFVEENRRVLPGEIKLDKAGLYTYIDSLKTEAYKTGKEQVLEVGCDSIWTLRLLVPPAYSFHETLTICENDTVSWQNILFIGSQFLDYGKEYDIAQYDSVRTNLLAGVYHSMVKYQTAEFECDSIYNAEIIVNEITHISISDRACQHDEFYYPNLNNGIGGNLNTNHVGEYTFVDTIQSHAGCDSIVTFTFNVDSAYNYSQKDSVCQEYGGVWTWYNEYGDKQAVIPIDKGDTTITIGTIYTTIYGCDSIFGMELYVKPIYHFYEEMTICESDSISWQGIWYSGNQFLDYNTNGFDASSYRRNKANLAAGIYNDTAKYTTHLGCDSIYHLTLTVNKVPRISISDRACQRDEFYYPNLNNGIGGNLNTNHVGEYTFVDTIQSHVGCDSIVTFTFNVDSVYDYRQYEEVCQDTINFQYEWIDSNTGASHGYIDISEAGYFTFEDTYKTIHGCDSIYGITLHVKPIYRFDSLYVICENERISWQNKWYAGDSAQIVITDNVLPIGMHYDTARYTTIEGCDSIYYLQLRVNAVYDTTLYATICYTDDYVWMQQDKYGTYETPIWKGRLQDTVRITVQEALLPQAAKDTVQMHFQNMLRTINDCDSLCRLVATIHPTYYFVTDTTICSNVKMLYRGKYFSSHDTIYTDKLTTSAGCDSIYQLRLHVKPTYIFNRTRIICDNETIYHTDSVEVLWRPGMEIPERDEFRDLVYLTREGCDSIYRYVITVNPTYNYSQNLTLCSNEQTLIQGEHYVGTDTLYDTGEFILPFDTIFTDSLSTINGCDSVYQIFAHILPQYCHTDYDTICDNETFFWQSRTLRGNVGTYRYDTTYTNIYGCDSTYILYLTIHPTYDITETVTICDDEVYEWEHRVFVGSKVNDDIEGIRLVADVYHFDTLYQSEFGCDSIRELNITILPTSEEERWDTICIGEQYVLPNKTVTAAGYYIDTTTNDFGCYHYIYLHLEVIEPTRVTATIDSICADQYPFMTLYYTYEGHAPVTVSVKFDEQGHEQGFEDIDFQPVSDMNEYSGYVDIPIPHGSVLPRPGKLYFDPIDERSISYGDMRGFLDADHYEFVRPGTYYVTLFLHNGICQSDSSTMTKIKVDVLYPHWIHEQHWNDAIVLFEPKYNGGYEFDSIQWYFNGKPMEGENGQYLYLPHQLKMNQWDTDVARDNEYRAALRRQGEQRFILTCPIYPVWMTDDIVPKEYYFSVVPTLVPKENPVVNILSSIAGEYEVLDTNGNTVIPRTKFQPDNNNVYGPIQLGMIGISGIYFFRIIAENGEQRMIKIIVDNANLHKKE